jgi:DNA-binding response OmpR family regulator
MGPQKTILIVDDEQDLRDTVGYLFKSRGYAVETAYDGANALTKLETVHPDLIILDMNMPKMNGLEFYERIKGKHERPRYPVLVLTARANMEDLFRSLDVDGFMAKPFELEQIFKESEFIIKKNSALILIDEDNHIQRARRICVVESHPETAHKVAAAFLEMGYIVNTAQSGASAILRMTMDPPDVALIHLGLDDIAGDVVIGKLHASEETKGIKYVLYTGKSPQKVQVTRKISEKEGIAILAEFTHPLDLLEAVDRLYT